jgi:predicted methyltransferase
MRRFIGPATATVTALALILAAGAAAPVLAQRPNINFTAPTDPSRGDALSNPAFKGPEVIAFMGLKRGQKVADVFAGRFTTAFVKTVGPKGKVYAVTPQEIIKIHPELTQLLEARAKQPEFAGVEFSTPAINDMALPSRLDAVFIRQNYHDLHVRFMGPADVAAFNKKVFAALKPGGVFVVLDHVALPGSGLVAPERLHRIDPEVVKQEVTAAGFVLDGESKVLANPADAHDKIVLDNGILGQTDQFLLRFKKPK